MNEQIGKLISEAIKAIPDHVDFDLPKEFTEKFAELIVRECLEQIHIQSRGRCGDYHGEWYESDILKHFGVEE
jgi:hypothetical protein